MSMFKKATRAQAKLRLALVGPSGAGKTYTALSIARHLGQRIAVIDTEHGSASKYAGDAADFDVLELETFAPRTYVEAIKAAEREGYDVIVVDSLSHAWMGKGGALEMVDAAAKRSQSKNTFMAWRDVTPEHNALVDALVQCRAHVIVTMRAKTEYVMEEDGRGKKTPVKIGLAPIQRDGLEYEMDVVADVNLEHDFMVSKTRCKALDKGVYRCAGEDVAGILKAWLSDGAPIAERVDPVATIMEALGAVTTSEQLADARATVKRLWGSLTDDGRQAVAAAGSAASKRVELAARAEREYAPVVPHHRAIQRAAEDFADHLDSVAVKHHGIATADDYFDAAADEG